MMLEQNKKRLFLKGALKEKVQDMSHDEIIDYLVESDEYYFYQYQYSKKTLMNRINLLWVYPLFLITIPMQWLISGDIGINRNSKVGRIVDYLVKFD